MNWGVSMTMTTSIRRSFAAAMLAASSLFLSGCFMVEDDDATYPILYDAIITSENSAKPLTNGAVRICDAAGSNCDAGMIRNHDDWGYEFSSPASSGKIEFYMRELTGAGIPANTYLVQGFSSDELLADYYQLGLAFRQNDGSWLIFQPDCEWARAQSILAQLPWVGDAGSGQCIIARSGLTDQRLFETLRMATAEEAKSRLYVGT